MGPRGWGDGRAWGCSPLVTWETLEQEKASHWGCTWGNRFSSAPPTPLFLVPAAILKPVKVPRRCWAQTRSASGCHICLTLLGLLSFHLTLKSLSHSPQGGCSSHLRWPVWLKGTSQSCQMLRGRRQLPPPTVRPDPRVCSACQLLRLLCKNAAFWWWEIR